MIVQIKSLRQWIYFLSKSGSQHIAIWVSMRENLSSVFANNKGADQLVHLRSLIGAFVIHLLESIISKLATGKISIF